MAGRDITEGDVGYGITYSLGIGSSLETWQNTDIAYDVALGGMPFIYATNDARPHIRQTASFKKQQFDNSAEPGEQSLEGWWIRSQMSFHSGDGIKFYDPATTDENGHYRFSDCKGLNPWVKGQVTMLKNSTQGHITTSPIAPNGNVQQHLRSIKWDGTPGVLLHDGYDVDKIDSSGTVTHFIDYNAGTDSKVYAVCDDGTYAYWITNTSTKKTVYKKLLTLNSGTAGTVMFDEVGTISNATMEYVKDRVILCADNKVYEFATSAVAMPTAVYTQPTSTHVYTSITASGPAIYIAGYNGIQSTIQKFTLSTAGVMPTLTSAVVAAELPVGEIVHKIYYYLGYMLIGTNKGIRVAAVSDQDGSLNYGPLIVETIQPCYDFAARDHYVWCATSVDGEPGVIRLDLSNQLEPMRFAYANDLYYSGINGYATTACAFIDGTERLAYATCSGVEFAVSNKALTSNVATLTTSTAHGLTTGDVVFVAGVDSTFNGHYTVTSAPSTTTFTYAKTASNVSSTAVSPTGTVAEVGYNYIEDASTLMSTGYLTTGWIRYGTLEPKNYKRLLGRGDFTYGSMTLETVDKDGVEYDHITYDSGVDPVEVTTSQPELAQEYVAYKFILSRDTTDTTKGPIFKGYQAKATIATPRQRAIQFYVYNMDIETDKYNVQFGYEGRANERLFRLEEIEQSGDIVTWQDLGTKESRQVQIESIQYMRVTPPDKESVGDGGVLQITVRTV